MPTRELLAGETKILFVYRIEHVNNKTMFVKKHLPSETPMMLFLSDLKLKTRD